MIRFNCWAALGLLLVCVAALAGGCNPEEAEQDYPDALAPLSAFNGRSFRANFSNPAVQSNLEQGNEVDVYTSPHDVEWRAIKSSVFAACAFQLLPRFTESFPEMGTGEEFALNDLPGVDCTWTTDDQRVNPHNCTFGGPVVLGSPPGQTATTTIESSLEQLECGNGQCGQSGLFGQQVCMCAGLKMLEWAEAGTEDQFLSAAIVPGTATTAYLNNGLMLSPLFVARTEDAEESIPNLISNLSVLDHEVVFTIPPQNTHGRATLAMEAMNLLTDAALTGAKLFDKNECPDDSGKTLGRLIASADLNSPGPGDANLPMEAHRFHCNLDGMGVADPHNPPCEVGEPLDRVAATATMESLMHLSDAVEIAERYIRAGADARFSERGDRVSGARLAWRGPNDSRLEAANLYLGVRAFLYEPEPIPLPISIGEDGAQNPLVDFQLTTPPLAIGSYPVVDVPFTPPERRTLELVRRYFSAKDLIETAPDGPIPADPVERLANHLSGENDALTQLDTELGDDNLMLQALGIETGGTGITNDVSKAVSRVIQESLVGSRSLLQHGPDDLAVQGPEIRPHEVIYSVMAGGHQQRTYTTLHQNAPLTPMQVLETDTASGDTILIPEIIYEVGGGLTSITDDYIPVQFDFNRFVEGSYARSGFYATIDSVARVLNRNLYNGRADLTDSTAKGLLAYANAAVRQRVQGRLKVCPGQYTTDSFGNDAVTGVEISLVPLVTDWEIGMDKIDRYELVSSAPGIACRLEGSYLGWDCDLGDGPLMLTGTTLDRLHEYAYTESNGMGPLQDVTEAQVVAFSTTTDEALRAGTHSADYYVWDKLERANLELMQGDYYIVQYPHGAPPRVVGGFYLAPGRLPVGDLTSDRSGCSFYPLGQEVIGTIDGILRPSTRDPMKPENDAVGVGESDRLRLPLETELTEAFDGQDFIESSFAHYLRAAEELANEADELGQQMVEQGLRMDERVEECRDALEDMCGGGPLNFGDPTESQPATCASDTECGEEDEWNCTGGVCVMTEKGLFTGLQGGASEEAKACLGDPDSVGALADYALGDQQLCLFRFDGGPACVCPTGQDCPRCPELKPNDVICSTNILGWSGLASMPGTLTFQTIDKTLGLNAGVGGDAPEDGTDIGCHVVPNQIRAKAGSVTNQDVNLVMNEGWFDYPAMRELADVLGIKRDMFRTAQVTMGTDTLFKTGDYASGPNPLVEFPCAPFSTDVDCMNASDSLLCGADCSDVAERHRLNERLESAVLALKYMTQTDAGKGRENKEKFQRHVTLEAHGHVTHRSDGLREDYNDNGQPLGADWDRYRFVDGAKAKIPFVSPLSFSGAPVLHRTGAVTSCTDGWTSSSWKIETTAKQQQILSVCLGGRREEVACFNSGGPILGYVQCSLIDLFHNTNSGGARSGWEIMRDGQNAANNFVPNLAPDWIFDDFGPAGTNDWTVYEAKFRRQSGNDKTTARCLDIGQTRQSGDDGSSLVNVEPAITQWADFMDTAGIELCPMFHVGITGSNLLVRDARSDSGAIIDIWNRNESQATSAPTIRNVLKGYTNQSISDCAAGEGDCREARLPDIAELDRHPVITNATVLDTLELACAARKNKDDVNCDDLFGPNATVDLSMEKMETADDFDRFARVLECGAVSVERSLSRMYFSDLPVVVANDLANGGVTSETAFKGQYGEDVNQVRTRIEQIREAANGIPFRLREFANAIRIAKARIVQHDAEAELAKLQFEQDVIEAIAACANGIGDMFKVDTIGQGITGAVTSCGLVGHRISIALNRKQAQIEAAEAGETIVVTQLDDTFGDTLESFSDTVSHVFQGYGEVAALLDQLAGTRNAGARELAKCQFLDQDPVGREFNVNRVMRQRFNTTKARYDKALAAAQKMASTARRAVEARLAVNLEDITSDLEFVPAPAGWVASVGETQGIDYSKIRDVNDKIPNYADRFVGDYVRDLKLVVESYPFKFPFQDGNDIAVISLRDELLNSTIEDCEIPSYNVLPWSGKLDEGAKAIGGGGWESIGCGGDNKYCVTVEPGNESPFVADAPSKTVPLDDVEAWVLRNTIADPAATTENHAEWTQALFVEAGEYILSWYEKNTTAPGTPLIEPFVSYFNESGEEVFLDTSVVDPGPQGMDRPDFWATDWHRPRVQVSVPRDTALTVRFRTAETPESAACRGTPVVKWPWEEAAAPFANQGTAGLLDLTVETGSFSAPSTWGTGDAGYALTFDGSSGLTTGATQVGESDALTILSWVNPDVTSSDHQVVAKIYSPTTFVNPFFSAGMRILSNNLWVEVASGGTRYTHNAGAAPSTGQWSQVAMTFDGWMLRAYENGQFKSELEVASPSGSPVVIDWGTNGPWGVGTWASPGSTGHEFDGQIGKTIIDSVAWTAAEIEAEYDATSQGEACKLPGVLWAGPQLERADDYATLSSGRDVFGATGGDGLRQFFPTTDELSASVGTCPDSTGVMFRSKKYWKEHFQTICVDPSGDSCTGPTATAGGEIRDYRETNFTLSLGEIERGEIISSGAIALGNYNYRIQDIAINLVGTGIIDCTGVEDQSSCFASAFVPYSLHHQGPFTVRNWEGSEYDVPLFNGRIQFAKGLTAERYITTPVSGSDSQLLTDFFKSEFNGRPLAGNYALRIWDSPGLKWDQVEDIQLIVRYKYWTRTE